MPRQPRLPAENPAPDRDDVIYGIFMATAGNSGLEPRRGLATGPHFCNGPAVILRFIMESKLLIILAIG